MALCADFIGMLREEKRYVLAELEDAISRGSVVPRGLLAPEPFARCCGSLPKSIAILCHVYMFCARTVVKIAPRFCWKNHIVDQKNETLGQICQVCYCNNRDIVWAGIAVCDGAVSSQIAILFLGHHRTIVPAAFAQSFAPSVQL